MKWIAGCLLFVAVQAHAAVLIIGDSVSLGYTPFVHAELPCVEHAPGNDRDSLYTRQHIVEWLANGHYDKVHVGVGLWDIAHRIPGSWQLDASMTSPISTTRHDFRYNLNRIIDMIQAYGATPILATMTSVPEGSKGRLTSDALAYNEIIRSVAFARGIQLDDIYEAMQGYDYLHLNQNGNMVHYSKHGYRIIAQDVISSIGGC